MTWIGYQAPQSALWGWNPLGNPLASDSVAQDDSARAGGADLAQFYRGIDASRATDPHLTALGHSYGSTTTGFALQEQTGVDDAIFFGSPGVGTSHIEDIKVPEGHTYRIEARRDFVADVSHFGMDPTYIDGMTGLSAREETLPDGRRLAESTGHSAYLAQDSTSQYNMSVVVAGLPDRRVEDSGRGVDGQSLTLDGWKSEGNLLDAQWGRAVQIVAEVTGEYGFGPPQTIVDRPGDHEITATDQYGAKYLFGTAGNTVLLVSTGCHLPANVHPGA